MIDVPLYLRTVFAAGDDGILTETVAEHLKVSFHEARTILESLFRARKLSRLPNPRGRGLVWRIPKRGDADAGLLWEPGSGDFRVDPAVLRAIHGAKGAKERPLKGKGGTKSAPLLKPATRPARAVPNGPQLELF